MNKKAEIKNRIDLINRGEVPEGYKKVHGYIIPNDWQITRFNKIFERITKKNDVGCKNVLTISAQYGLINQQEFFKKSIASADTSNYFLLNKNDFAYNKSYSAGYPFGTIKKMKLYEQGIVSPLYICFRAKPKLMNIDYIEQYFDANKFNSEILAIAQEGARNHGLLNMSIDDFFNCNIVKPSQQEQEKIAKILKCCDKVIELKEKLLEEKLNEKKYLMDKTFSKKYENNYQLKNLGTTFIGLSNKNKKDFGYGKPYIPYINIFNNTFVDASKLEYVNILQNENQATVKYGDIFFTTSSECPEEVGMTSVWLHNLAEVYLNSFCFGYRLNDFKILIPEYAGYYFRSPNFRVVLNKLAQGVTRFNLSKNNLMEERISLPSLEKQKQIAKIFLKIDKQIKLIQQELEQYKQLKKSLSQLLLTGIVRTVEVDCEN